MSIGGKKFNVYYSPDGVPDLRLDLIISFPDSKVKKRKKVEGVLLDTGSDITCIPHTLVSELNLIPTGRTVEIIGFNNTEETISLYSAKITINSIIDEIVEVGAAEGEPVIGLNLLLKWHTLINGPEGTFEIATV